MLESIITAIAQSIDAAFGENYTIYTEPVEQGLQKPCFFILPTKEEKKYWIGKRAQTIYHFQIYFYSENGKNSELGPIADTLFRALEYIHVDMDMLRGYQESSTVSDGRLQCSVHYNVFTWEVEEDEYMEVLEQKERWE